MEVGHWLRRQSRGGSDGDQSATFEVDPRVEPNSREVAAPARNGPWEQMRDPSR
jgi:hypothetical protein